MTAASFLKKYFFIDKDQTTEGLSIPYEKVIRLMKRYETHCREDIKCKCKESKKHGETSVMCCNSCGLPAITETWWTNKEVADSFCECKNNKHSIFEKFLAYCYKCKKEIPTEP